MIPNTVALMWCKIEHPVCHPAAAKNAGYTAVSAGALYFLCNWPARCSTDTLLAPRTGQPGIHAITIFVPACEDEQKLSARSC